MVLKKGGEEQKREKGKEKERKRKGKRGKANLTA